VIPTFKPGVQMVFIAAPDVELADFLRAQRANTLSDWEDFSTRYPSSDAPSSAQDAIAGFHQQAAEAAFAQYQEFERRQDARSRHAAAGVPGGANRQPVVSRLQTRRAVNGHIGRELDNLARADQTRLQAYRKALQDHTPGYSQLSAPSST
jgi:hypothetical protein